MLPPRSGMAPSAAAAQAAVAAAAGGGVIAAPVHADYQSIPTQQQHHQADPFLVVIGTSLATLAARAAAAPPRTGPPLIPGSVRFAELPLPDHNFCPGVFHSLKPVPDTERLI